MKYINLQMSRLWMILLSTAVLCLYSCAGSYQEEIGEEAQLMNDITLNVTSPLPMAPNMQFQVNYTAIPDNVTYPGVSWISSNTSVAEVTQDGLITAKQLGQAFINISQSTTGFNVLKSIEVNVVPPATSITAKNFQLIDGTTANLSDTKYVTVVPANGYNLYDVVSSNTSVVIFENGLLKAVSPGTATITVKTKDGSNLQSTATVTVIPSIPPTALTIAASQEFGNNEFSAKLDFTITPSNATLELIQWTSSNPSIVTIDEKGKITTLNFGDVQITAKLPNGTEIKQTISVVKGKINDYNLGLNIYTLTNNATSNLTNGVRRVTYASGQKRSDLVRGGTTYIDVDKFPILAIKRNAPTIAKLWHTFDSKIENNTAGGLNMVWANVLPTKDGAQVYYVNLAAVTYGGATLVGKASQKMNLFQFKTGTDNTNPPDYYYDLYWVKTFKSMTDLNNYIANE